MIRGDLSNRLVHLTRGTTPQEAATRFESILKEKALRGSNGDIRGGYKCVCFSEAPLAVLTHALAAPAENGMRYAPFGIIVGKSWLFQQGGRPVIYQTHEEYELLHEALKFRHVRYEPHLGRDYTWEREWRIQTEVLALDPEHMTIVVPTRKWEARIQEKHIDNVATLSWILDIPMSDPMPWHFIVLEDLGVEGFEEYDF